MVKLAGKTVADIATDLITDQIVQITEKVIKKLIRPQVDNGVEKKYPEIATEEMLCEREGLALRICRMPSFEFPEMLFSGL